AVQDVSFRNDLFRSNIQDIAPLGQPRVQRTGNSALLTLEHVPIPPSSAANTMSAYRTTYFPSATSAGEAMQITLQSGEERTDLAIALRPVPAVRVSGRLVAPDGTAPPPMAIRLSGDGARDVVTTGLASGLGPTVGEFDSAYAVSDLDGS